MKSSQIASKHCVPCEGGVDPLTPEKIQEYLPLVPEWTLVEGKLTRTRKWKNFKEAIAFINRVADIAETEGHHPDISLFGWNNVKLVLFTHAIDGLHENDFILAAKIDVAVNALKGR